MENMENLEVVKTPENVEQTTEQAPKMFTQEEVNEIVGKAKARTRAKVEKENERRYGSLMDTLKAGTGKETVEEVEDTFRQFYQKKGIQLHQKPTYSEEDLKLLGKADAEEIIRSGYEEVVEEVDRLTALGYEKMSQRDKAVFKILAEHRQSAERGRELAKIGVTEDVYNSKEFADFAAQFNSSVPISKVYQIFEQTQPKKEFKTMGSMKNSDSGDSGVKDFYTPEEARKFTKKDFDKNPALFAAVEKSMLKWKR